MKNYVQMGRLVGAKIVCKNDELFFQLSRQQEMPINRNIVERVEPMGITESKSFLSGLLRGWIGKLFGNTAWLAAIQSAKPNILYHLRLTYRDGSRSIVLVDQNLYLKFMEIF